ncbi:MAG: hypothetical protein KAI83_02230 [Thiomargarita sp.]|nr:hypothetical protein [Thiomargarita sp.]
MKHLNEKHYIWILIGFSILIYLVILFLFPIVEKTRLNYLKPVPTVVTIDLILVYLFSNFIWKWNLLYSWLVPFPNLNGTWKGVIRSTWVDPKTNKRLNPIPVILTIKQTFLSISCVMRTQEMESRSFIGSFRIDADNQLLQLVYSYASVPTKIVENRSTQHFGTIIFNIINDETQELRGEYWTDRKTTGAIELAFWKNKMLDKYPDDIGEHPMN